MMELATIAFTGDDIDESDPADDEEDFESNLAVGVRFIQGQIQPSISFVFPLDDEARDAIDFMFLVGVQGILAAP
jgi:hypothetical protein